MPLPPFAVFLEQQREPVYRFLVASVGAQSADDCFQETFLSALRAYPRLRADSNLRAWVLAIASRKAIDHHRGERRRPLPVADVPERPAPAHASEPGVRRAVDALPDRQRIAVVLRYALDLSYAEVARVLGCSEEAARANAYEGRKKLRARLGARA
jgi:RNA polymerase sigma factor (sigma-70 family)